MTLGNGRDVGTSGRGSGGAGRGIQVICLGSGGGPSEDNVTGFLVRSAASNWAKGSLLAVDAGTHLAAITRILEHDFPLVSAPERPKSLPPDGNHLERQASTSTGPDTPSSRAMTPEPVITTLPAGSFAGLPFPHASARANAAHVVREHVATYLITHPHLDHLSGFAINTAAFHNTSRPKRLAALPFTVNAIKQHIFNDLIWPNLTDEDGGVGFVTFQRLQEGGNSMLGDGAAAGYIEVCDGLAVKGFRISHGHCIKCPSGHGSAPTPRRERSSLSQIDPMATPQHSSHNHNHSYSHSQSQSHTDTNSLGHTNSFPPAQNQVQPYGSNDRRGSMYSQPSAPGTPGLHGGPDSAQQQQQLQQQQQHQQQQQQQAQHQCVVDSTAYFIRTTDHFHPSTHPATEILIFGDVEPDSLSFAPRTALVWAEAAPKIALGLLRAVFLECSYDDRQRDEVLFGHLAPRHVVAELSVLAEMVVEKKREMAVERERHLGRKRKRLSGEVAAGLGSGYSTPGGGGDAKRSRSHARTVSSPAPMGEEIMRDVEATGVMMYASMGESRANTTQMFAAGNSGDEGPLKGVKVVVIHVKDTMADGPRVEDCILEQLVAHEERLKGLGKGLGCEFVVSESGDSYWF